MLLSESQNDQKMLDLWSYLGAKKVNSCVLIASGMEHLLIYQIIFKNVAKVPGRYTTCGTAARSLFVSYFVFVYP